MLCKPTTLYTGLKFIQSGNDLLPSKAVRKSVSLSVRLIRIEVTVLFILIHTEFSTAT